VRRLGDGDNEEEVAPRPIRLNGGSGARAVMMWWWIPDDPGGGNKTLAPTGQGAVEP
jgi:hypothetical protein